MPPKKKAAGSAISAKGKKLVIVESPSKAKTINKYLGDEYTVFASVGHIKDLPKKEIGLDFENHYEPRYEVITGKEKVVRDMKKLSKESSEVMIATDPDREGEAIAWHISNEVEKNQTNISRVLFNEITAKAIREAIQEKRQINYSLVRSQQARQAMDKIVGYRISPFLWDTVLRGLSAGRVQSVALRLICEREDEINAFNQEEYWSITADFQTPHNESFKAKLHKINNQDFRISSENEANAIAEKAKSRVYRIQEIKRRKTRRNPPSPFTTSLLQQSASNQLGYGSKKTMRLAQQLYEGIDIGQEGAVGLITYMRTDSKRVSADAQNEAREFIGRQFGDSFVPEKPKQYKTSDKAQDAHEAIRPTSVFRTPKQLEHVLTKEQYRLYDLIWRRFLASQMTPAELEQTSIDVIDHEKEFLFRASGSVVKFEGFLKLFGDQKELDYEDQKSTKVDTTAETDVPTKLPKRLNEKDQLSLLELLENQHFTKPPARYTEASLVKELDNFGIGRPSTYASILSTLVDRRYVEIRQKRFFPNELGKDVSKILIANFPELFNVAFTAEMETDLDKVATGEQEYESVLDQFYKPLVEALDIRKANPILPQNENAKLCDKCHEGFMVVKWTKSGKFLGCSNYPKCKNIQKIETQKAEPQETGIKCPKCESGRLVLRDGRFGKFLACNNYPQCNGLLNINKKGLIEPPKMPPFVTDIECPICGSPLYLRLGKRGFWLGCSKFPKCKGRKSWTELDDKLKQKLESEFEEHKKQNPQDVIKMLDGSRLNYNQPLEDLLGNASFYLPDDLTNEQEATSGEYSK